MLIRRPADIAPSEITPEAVYRARRRFLGQSAALAAIGLGGSLGMSAHAAPSSPEWLTPLSPSPFSTDESRTSLKDITRYNNFYEFGTHKEDPLQNAGRMKTEPWTVTVEGLVNKPRTFDIDQLRRLAPMEERIYRLRCVETWSMVVPWVGYPLAALLREVEPQGSARYVELVSHYDPEIMIRREVIRWPYREGLRLDEALHPLTLLVFGLYGETLPNQNGAPLRLMVPWKYGFKSGKSIVTIRLTETQPATSWNVLAPHEYGFFANVNPEVTHPRWSQARERRIGEFRKRPTQMFNGYGEQVASLYQGMDLTRYY